MKVAISNMVVLVVVLVLGCSMAVALHHYQMEGERVEQRAEIKRQVNAAVQVLRSKILRSTEILSSVVALFEARGPREVSRTEFRQFVSPALSRQPELLALEWIPKISAAERSRYEQNAAADGLDGFQVTEISAGVIRPAASRPEYFPVYYLEPIRGNAPALGLDLGHHEQRRLALEKAADSGQASATEPIQLAQEASRKPGFLVFARVLDDRDQLAGFALAVFRVESLVDSALSTLVQAGWQVEIRDFSEPSRSLLYQGGPAATEEAEDWKKEETLKVAGREWNLCFFPPQELVSPRGGVSAWSGPTGMVCATLLLSAYMARGMRRAAIIEQKVTEKTAELSHEVGVRKSAEEAMREAEEKYRSIFENAINGIFQSTPEGRYINANPALAKLYGYSSPEELLGALSHIESQLYVEPDRRLKFMKIIHQHGTIDDFISQVYRKDRTIIWISEKALSVKDDAGQILYYEGMVEDVTARVEASNAQRRLHEVLEEKVTERTAQLALTNQALQEEIAIRKAAEEAADNANRAKSLFLADMSHEIRTPLNAILRYTQLLQRDATLNDDQVEAVRTIVEGGNHLLCLVDGVLDLTKIEVGRMELEPVDFDLTVLVKGMAAMFHQRCQQKGLHLQVENLGAKAMWLYGDERKLRQALVNLLSNAVKFTDHGEVLLRVVPVDGRTEFRFEVIDTGPGIPEKEQRAIFEPFQQQSEGRQKGGTGLGLSIARRLIDLMGGELSVQSTPGWGSNFFFTLHFDAAHTVQASMVNEPDLAARLAPDQQVRALVVDDMVINRDILSRMLNLIGCEVKTATCGQDALQMEAQHEIDIVFMDIRMPDMDGLETARQMQQRHLQQGSKTPRLVIYSAFLFEHERIRYEQQGFDDVFPKPFKFERLHECLQRLLGVSFVTNGECAGLHVANPVQQYDFTTLQLPAHEIQRLRVAADIGDFAVIRQALDRMTQIGGEAASFAEVLRPMVRHFNVEGVLALLESLPESDPAFAQGHE